MATKISYCDETWNPMAGCSPCSPGCDNCYASRAACGRFLKEHPLYKGLAKNNKWTGRIRTCIDIGRPDILDKPLRWRKPRTIFVCDMSDLFHPAVRFEFIAKMWDIMLRGGNIESNPVHLYRKEHKFLILTKRPQRLLEFSQWMLKNHLLIDYPNVYPGTTICNQAEADEKIPILLQIPAAKRWLSIEPVLEPIRLFRTNPCEHRGCFSHRTHPCEGCGYMGGWPVVDWVVVGCESGPNRRFCKLDWIVEIVEQCQTAGIKVFVKQVSINGKVSHDMSEWPEKLRVRELL